MEYNPVRTEQLILCSRCGVATPPTNPGFVCNACLQSYASENIVGAAGIPLHDNLHFCRQCERYFQPPNAWIPAALESRELLSLCLKKIRSLNKVRLVDAGFIFTGMIGIFMDDRCLG